MWFGNMDLDFAFCDKAKPLVVQSVISDFMLFTINKICRANGASSYIILPTNVNKEDVLWGILSSQKLFEGKEKENAGGFAFALALPRTFTRMYYYVNM